MSITRLHEARASRHTSRIASAMCVVIASAGTIASFAALAAETKTDVNVEREAQKAEADREKQLADARKRLDAAAREIAELSMHMSSDAMPRVTRMFSRMGSKAMLGVNIGTAGEADRSDGVEILSVSPSGPAAQAGLKAGDVIVEIKGKPLKKSGDESPSEQLLAAMREVNPEEKVAVRYLRDGKTATATVIAGPVDRLFSTPFPIHGTGPMAGMPNFAFLRADGVFGSAELVSLTPKLGQYFGTEKGLLVVRAPDSRLKLEEGDVIVDIDGRVPSSPSHAFRILGSYQTGEKVKLNVLRMKKRMTFEVEVPAEQGIRRRFEGQHAPPPPPMPPSGDFVIPAPAAAVPVAPTRNDAA